MNLGFRINIDPSNLSTSIAIYNICSKYLFLDSYKLIKMKKLLLIFSLFIMVSSAFAQTAVSDKVNPEIKTFRIYKNSTIVTDVYDKSNFAFEIKSGNAMVFEYYFKAREYENVADDEFSEKIVFEFTPKGRKFEINTADLKTTKVIYNRSCFCMDRGNYFADNVKIIGKRGCGKKWNIEIELSIKTPQDRGGNDIVKKISGVYRSK